MGKQCTKCNSIFEDDAIKFCANCGSSEFTPIVSANPQQQPAMQQENGTVSANEQPQYNGYVPSNMPVNYNIKPPKKNKSFLFKIIIPAVAVVLSVVIALNAYPVWAFMVKTFGSNESYMRLVENHAIKSYSASLGRYYEGYFTDYLGDVKVEASADLQISDELKDLAENYDIELDGLEKAGLKFVINSQDTKFAESVVASIGGQNVLSSDFIFDLENESFYVACKELTDKILFFDLKELTSGSSADFSNSLELKKAYRAAMPKASTIENLSQKYVKLALDEIKNVDVSSENVEAGNISQNLTTVTFTIDNDTCVNIIKSVIRQAKIDKDIMTILNNFQKAFEDTDMFKGTNLYEEYIKGIESIEDNIDDTDILHGTKLKFVSYVDGGHEIVGLKVSVKNQGYSQDYKYVTIQRGKDFATEVDLGVLSIFGSGVKSGGKITGQFKASYQGNDMCTLDFNDFRNDALKNGEIKGVVRITPSSSLLKQISRSASSYLSLSNISLLLDLDIKKSSGSAVIKPLINDKEMLSLAIRVSRSSGSNITVPSSNKLDATDEDDLEEFIDSIDFNKFISNLKKTSIPKKYIEDIEDALDNLNDNPSSLSGLLGFRKASSSYNYNNYNYNYNYNNNSNYYNYDYDYEW